MKHAKNTDNYKRLVGFEACVWGINWSDVECCQLFFLLLCQECKWRALPTLPTFARFWATLPFHSVASIFEFSRFPRKTTKYKKINSRHLVTLELCVAPLSGHEFHLWHRAVALATAIAFSSCGSRECFVSFD